MSRSGSIAVAAALLVSAPLLAAAQTPPQGGDHSSHAAGGAAPSPGGGMMMHGGGMGGMAMGGMPFQHVEGRLAFLKTEMKITPAQEPQWSKFADAVRSVAQSARGAMQQMMQGRQQSKSATDVLNGYEKMLIVRLDAVRQVKGAFEPLYATMSDEQKKVADELLASPMGVM